MSFSDLGIRELKLSSKMSWEVFSPLLFFFFFEVGESLALIGLEMFCGIQSPGSGLFFELSFYLLSQSLCYWFI